MRCNQVGCAATACLLVAVTTFTSAVALAPQSSRSPQHEVAWSAPTQIMSPVVVASWITERLGGGSERLQLLVLWRGTPGWFLADGRNGFSGGGSAGRYHQTITEGDLRLTLDYDSSRQVATVQEKTIELAGDDVVLVDDSAPCVKIDRWRANACPPLRSSGVFEVHHDWFSGHLGRSAEILPGDMTY